MKTAIEQVREALDAAIPVSNIAYNLGQSHGSKESNLKCVARFDELRCAALTALKSLEGQEVVAWMHEHSGGIITNKERVEKSAKWDALHPNEKGESVVMSYTIPLVRLTKSANT